MNCDITTIFLFITWIATFAIGWILLLISKLQKSVKRGKIFWIIALYMHGTALVTSISLLLVTLTN